MEDMLTVDLLHVQHLCIAVKQITRKQKEETCTSFLLFIKLNVWNISHYRNKTIYSYIIYPNSIKQLSLKFQDIHTHCGLKLKEVYFVLSNLKKQPLLFHCRFIEWNSGYSQRFLPLISMGTRFQHCLLGK